MKNLVLLLLVFVVACAGEVPSTQTLRMALNHMALGLNQIKPALVALCKDTVPPAPPPPQECVEAVAGFNDVAADHKMAQDALDTVEQVTP